MTFTLDRPSQELVDSIVANVDRDHVTQALMLILGHPESHRQETFLGDPYDSGYDGGDISTENLCGTTACVAGWGSLLYGYRFKYEQEPKWNGDWRLHVAFPGEAEFRPMASSDFAWESTAAKYFGFDAVIANDIFWDFNQTSVIGKLVALVDGTYKYPVHQYENFYDEDGVGRSDW
jgi:hypothetical protein